MADTVTEGLERLNQSDMSQLRAKLDAIRADLEKALALQGKQPTATATARDITAAAAKAGVSVDDFIAALEWAKKMGLI